MSVKEKSDELTPGIVYLSRIPPSMNPLKMKAMLSQFGEVGRVYLQAEDEAVRKRRKKTGGNTRKQFTEGWIEYLDKRVAKSVAKTLNNTNIGGKKRYYYHDDIWNIKYLTKFKWVHISEKLAYEKAAREQRMRAEISQAKKEVNFYLENVSKGKAVEAIKEKKKRKRKLPENSETEPVNKVNRSFTQKPSKQLKSEKSQPLNPKLLSKIFSSG